MSKRSLTHPAPPEKGMIRVAPMAAIPGLLREWGVAPAPFLKRFGMTEDLFRHPDSTVPFALLGRVLDACARETGCPHFGLLVGQRGGASTLGAIGFLMRNAPDVGSALNEAIVNIDLHDRGAAPFLDKSPKTAVLGYAIHQPDLEGALQIVDGSLAIIWNIMRGLCGPQWLPREVRFRRDRPADIGAYRRFFQAPLRFNAPQDALVFDLAWLDQPLKQPDPQLHQHFLLHVQDMRRYSNQDFREKALLALLCLLGTQRCTLDDLATHFSMHPRTLNRRLQDSGTSFRALHQEARHQTARRLMRDTLTPIESIATLLGYSDSTAFNRAFSQWEGVSPGKWRRQCRTGSD